MSLYNIIPILNNYKTLIAGYGLLIAGIGGLLVALGDCLVSLDLQLCMDETKEAYFALVAALSGLGFIGNGHKMEKLKASPAA